MFAVFNTTCLEQKKKIAIVAPEMQVSYEELLNLVTKCAEKLIEFNCGSTVAICAPSKLSAIILMLSCIKLRKTFVPIDAEVTENAKKQILSLAGCSVVVSAFNVNDCSLDLLHLEHQEHNVMRPGEIMSIMFTSGSTGVPKGVLVKYSAVLNLLHRPKFFQIESDDVFGTYSPLSFDASTFEIFTPLLNGNTLVLLNKFQMLETSLLNGFLLQHKISILWITAGLFNSMVLNKQANALFTLRNLLVGGDKVDFHAALTFLESTTTTKLFNCYGPTENTIFSIVALLTIDTLNAGHRVPIGIPVNGVQCEIVNDEGVLLQNSATGKLVVSGMGLSDGYINDSRSQSFYSHPSAVSGVFYDTGDEVFRDPNGVYYYLGRKDNQVKLNGYRVDLDGVSTRCAQADIVNKNVHVYYSQQLQGLVAVFQSTIQLDLNTELSVKAKLKQILNPWEMPKRIFFVPNWPLTLNGKVDSKKLVDIVENTFLTGLSENKNAYLNDIVKNLLKIESEELQGDCNLFDIGFDSLSINKLIAEIKSHFGVSISLMEIFEAGNLARLEKIIHAK